MIQRLSRSDLPGGGQRQPGIAVRISAVSEFAGHNNAKFGCHRLGILTGSLGHDGTFVGAIGAVDFRRAVIPILLAGRPSQSLRRGDMI